MFVKSVYAAGIDNPKSWLAGQDAGGWLKPSNFSLSFFTDNVVKFLVGGLVFLVTTLSLVFLIVGGVMWMTSGGDKEGLAKAKNTITYALVGLALGLASFIILDILGRFFGVNLVTG